MEGVDYDFEAEDWAGLDGWTDSVDMAEVLRDVLDDMYADASPEDLEDALANMLEEMSPAEAFNFTKALKQIGQGAGQILSDPAFGRVAQAVLPVAGGALGTVIGGPVGTALGSSLGTAAARALPARAAVPEISPATRPAPTSTVRPAAAPTPTVAPATTATTTASPLPTPVAGGSAAAAQGLVLTQQPDVLKSLLAMAMGRHGQRTVDGVPVATIMNMLSSVFAQAAEDADQLMYLDEGTDDIEDVLGPLDDAGRSVYTALMDAENAELAEALEES